MPLHELPFVILGAGKSAARHLRAARTVPELEFRGVFDVKASQAETFAAAEGGTAFRSLPQALAEARGGFALICTPPSTHAELAEHALDGHIDVLVEKPFSIDLRSLDHVALKGARHGLIVGAVAQHRFSRGAQELREAIRSGEIGPLRRADIVVKRCRPERVFRARPWRRDPAVSGGGVLITVGFHYVDVACSIIGPPSDAMLGEAEVACGIDTAVRAEFKLGGVPASVDARWGEDVADEPDEIRILADRSISLRGGLLAGGPPVSSVDLHAAQLIDFADAVRRRRTPRVTASDVRPALELIFGLYEQLPGGFRNRPT